MEARPQDTRWAHGGCWCTAGEWERACGSTLYAAVNGYECHLRRFLTVKATPGNVELRDVSRLLTRRLLRFGGAFARGRIPDIKPARAAAALP